MNWKIPSPASDLLTQLLSNRGIKTKEDIEQFFNPKLENYDSDLQIPHIDRARTRILQAIRKEDLIFVSGDYDVDGICGAAVLYLGLTLAGAKVLPYIPHREREGYGLSKIGLDFAKESGAKLVISVDCGIVNFEESDYAKTLGLDLIITDHHQPLKGKKPAAEVIVHSTKICGTAVAWCLVKSLISKEEANDLLDLVAIATVADMMPMLGVNRALVKEGLKYLNKTTRVGLLALINESGLNVGAIGSYEIGHILAPRLNAAGRLESAMDSLRLICTKNKLKAIELARKLGEINIQRKELTQSALESARLKIKIEDKIHVLWDESWNPGIIGLVAGRVADETGRPTIAMAVGEVHAKGSARSVNGLNIVEMIRECSDILVAVGGHPGAAGFTIESKKIVEFKERMTVLMKDVIEQEKNLEVEAEVESRNLSLGLAKKIAEFAPFGLGNPEPLLVTPNLKLSNLRTVGGDKHLKGKADGIDFIAFGKGDLKEILGEGTDVSVVYNLEIDGFNGIEKPQLKVKDLKL
ncbi:MAG: single-stranded-DNA-specific exonuclease RecJ [Candidatus Daviesbacteria bacterium]|nr:single-stranded-DNA-specific exonuclease RecJ [Candidatus Daviesbacteria bacterium]